MIIVAASPRSTALLHHTKSQKQENRSEEKIKGNGAA